MDFFIVCKHRFRFGVSFQRLSTVKSENKNTRQPTVKITLFFAYFPTISLIPTADPTAFRLLSGQKVYWIGLWSEPKNILDCQLEEISFETIKSFIYCISWINRWTQKSQIILNWFFYCDLLLLVDF